MGLFVKKTIAAGGASLLGIGAASLGAAAPAAALPVTDPCATGADHTITVGALGDNWFMDCIPQYGVAEVAFEIVSAAPFPASFMPINDAAVTRVASTGAAGATYFGSSEQGFTYFDHLFFLDTDTSQFYNGNLIVPISSVGSILPADLPDGCTGTYSTAFIVNYAPVSVTFTQIVDGVEWRYDLQTAPEPLYLGLNILNTGVLDPVGNQCASSNGDLADAVDNLDDDWFVVEDIVSPGNDTLNPYFGDAKDLPDVSRYVAPPSLPAMGMEIQPAVPIGIAALFLSLGVTAGVLRRRRASDSAA